METQERKQRIKDYFVEIKEDKFTKVKSIKCKHKIEWKGKELENKFMLTKDSYTNSLAISIDYRHKDDVDSVFLGFTYSNTDGGYPGMTNIKMYLILDDDKTIELSEGSGFDHASQSSKVGDNYISVYIETAQLALSMSDFIAIANAKKIEYSIRFGQGSLENAFSQNDLLLFKGFYNAAFDNDFEIDLISNSNKVKLVLNNLLSNFQKIIDSAGYECIKAEVDIEQFRFEPKHKSPIQLAENENVILATYSNFINKTLCDVLITNKCLYYYNRNNNKVEFINLIGELNFTLVAEWGTNLDKLVEKSSSFSKIILQPRMAFQISKLLNSIIQNNNAAFDDKFESNLIFDPIKDSKPFSLSSNQNDEIIILLKEGKKLAAVKLQMELTGMGLKESKDYVEQLAKDNKIVGVVASNGKGGCFIATAALGNYDHPVVVELRFFRDNWLLKRKWGLIFTNWYYANGPKAAVIIEKSIILRKLTFILVVKPLQLFSKILN
jgi:hypothetical protein